MLGWAVAGQRAEMGSSTEGMGAIGCAPAIRVEWGRGIVGLEIEALGSWPAYRAQNRNLL